MSLILIFTAQCRQRWGSWGGDLPEVTVEVGFWLLSLKHWPLELRFSNRSLKIISLFQGSFKIQAHVHMDSDIPDSLGFPPGPSLFLFTCFWIPFLMLLTLPEWTLNFKATFTVCKLVNSKFVSPGRPALSPDLKTCWTWLIWDVHPPSSSYPTQSHILLMNRLMFNYEALDQSFLAKSPTTDNHAWWAPISKDYSVCQADRIHCWEVGQFWPAGTAPHLSHPALLPSAQDSTLTSYIQPLHLWILVFVSAWL